MSNKYILLVRNQNNNIQASMNHDNAEFIHELSVLHSYFLNNLKYGAVRAEIHNLLPEEKLPQAVERIERDNPKPLAAVTKDDLSAQEIEEH